MAPNVTSHLTGAAGLDGTQEREVLGVPRSEVSSTRKLVEMERVGAVYRYIMQTKLTH